MATKCLVKVFEICDYILHNHEATAVQIANELNIPKPTLYRLLREMRSLGLVHLDQNNQYSLGVRHLNYAASILEKLDIRYLAKPAMRTLRDLTKESVSLFTWSSIFKICIERVESPHELRPTIDIGKPFPIYVGASGKVLLAFLDPKTCKDLLDQIMLNSLTENTIMDKRLLSEELNEIKRLGYAISFGERSLGVNSIAAPIFNHVGLVEAAVSISGPDTRMTKNRMEGFIERLLETSMEISKLIGYLGS